MNSNRVKLVPLPVPVPIPICLHFICRYYDYNDPLAVPEDLRGSVDYILMDPPYLVRSKKKV